MVNRNSEMRWLAAALLGVCLASVLWVLPLAREQWTRQDIRSAADGSKVVQITLKADAPVQGWLTKRTPVLVIRCSGPRLLRFSVITGMDTIVEPGDRRSVRLQFDDEPPAIVEWNQAQNHQELTAPAPDAAALVRRLFRARQFMVAFVPFHADPVVATFTVEGFPARWETIRSTCGIP